MTALGRVWRLTVVCVLGFASGLPLALVGGAMQAWLTIEGLELSTIGFLTLIGVPYTIKFLWAPLIDRFEPPLLGRRRGWIVLTQLAVAGALFALSGIAPVTQLPLFAAVAVAAAFISATQDIAIDAYRADLLKPAERGLGSSLSVLGYRVAMVVSGGLALVWAQQWDSWPRVYQALAWTMAWLGVFSLLALPRLEPVVRGEQGAASRELFGFAALAVGAFLGYRYLGGGVVSLLGLDDGGPWTRLIALVIQLAFAVGLGLLAAKKAGFPTLFGAIGSYFASPGAKVFLALIVLYKVGDAFALSLSTAFLLRGVGFEQIEVGLANKTIGLTMTIVGAMIGGALLMRLRLSHALIVFGVLQTLANLGYYALAVMGQDAVGTFLVPAFNLGIVELETATPMDGLLLLAISADNLTGGMGTAARVALLMALCNVRFSATHFALLSAFASLGRVFIGPLTGVVAEQYGWDTFFLLSMVVALPGLALAWRLRQTIDEVDRRTG